ncbi:hypothetical protein [Dokdonella soli]|uniref:hypothetical protein n=1 Tax=Dokdonella soli TaxID=529810 RepID=UPI0031D7D8FC
MVTLLSTGGGVTRALPPFGAAIVSGLLVVTNFPGFSVLRVDDCGFAGAAAPVFFWTTGFTGTTFFAGTGLACFAGNGFAAFFTGFAGAAFFAAGFLTTAFEAAPLEAGFAATFLGATDFVDFFTTPAAGFAFVAGLAAVLRDALAAARATGFA